MRQPRKINIDEIICLDPAEIFEFASAECAANAYDSLINYNVDNVSEIYPGIAESWDVSDDGLTYTFKIRKGVSFASGNTLSADDVVFSLRRVVLLDKSPAFILTQFGFTPENVEKTITKVDDYTVKIIVDQAYAPSFFLYCLTSTTGSVVDKKEVMAHEKDGDLGYGWLKTGYAGSGPYTLRTWNSIIKFLGNLFKFKAETIFNRRNIKYILRIKNLFQRRSWAN